MGFHIPQAVRSKAALTKNRSTKRDPFFDPFFNSFFTETKTKFIKSKKRNITIKPFPEPKPTDFSGAFLGDVSNLGSGTSQLIPLVKIAPRCPPEASRNGIDGEVVLSLVVNASGKVETVKLVSSKPARIFNREASKAVRRWQFKPKTIDGVAVSQKGQLKVEFVCNV